MTKKKKIILSIVAVVLALATYGYFFGVQTVCVVGTRLFFHNPVLNIVPEPMTVESCSAPAATIKAFDYSISVPWQDQDCEQSMNMTSFVVWSCSDSNIKVFAHQREEELLRSMVSNQKIGQEDFEKGQNSIAEHKAETLRYLGLSEVEDRNYHYAQALWNITPQDVTFSDSKSVTLAKSNLLLLKAISVPKGVRRVYSFEHEGIKGFQIGTVNENMLINLYIFDQADREYWIMIGCRTNSPPAVPLTQADINTIITTFSSKP